MTKPPHLVRVEPTDAPRRPDLTVFGYAATQTEEGLVVHDVPIFCACARDEFQFDEQWVKAAVANAMRRQGENYFAPLHIRHHDFETSSNDSVRTAGHFAVTRTGPITLGGVRRTAVFADLVFTDPCAAADVLARRLPYRSVEIFDIDEAPSIDSLALLDHEAPYLELPMLHVGEVLDEREEVYNSVAGATFQTKDVPTRERSVIAFSRQGQTARLTFREETTMAARKKKTTSNAFGAGVTTKQKNFAEDDDKEEKMEADDKGGEESMEGEGEGGLDVGAVVSAIESGEISVANMDLLLVAIQSQGATEDVVEEEPEAAPAPAPDAMQASASKSNASKFAKMQGKIDAMEAKDAARDASDKRTDDVTAAMSRLADLPLGSNLKGKLVNFHKKHGGDAFGDYVESLAQNTAVEPGDRTDTAAAFGSQGGKLPEVAMKYQKDGVEAVNHAARFCREHDELKGSGIRSSQEAYVRVNMARLAKKA